MAGRNQTVNMDMSRRSFLLRSSAAVTGAAFGRLLPARSSLDTLSEVDPPDPIIDFHVHLFGVGDGGTGCYLSNKQRRHPTYPFFKMMLGLRENGRMDEDYIQRLVAMLRGSSVSKAVLLAQDSRYDSGGYPDREHTNTPPSMYRTITCFELSLASRTCLSPASQSTPNDVMPWTNCNVATNSAPRC
jgi:hypothetical protein